MDTLDYVKLNQYDDNIMTTGVEWCHHDGICNLNIDIHIIIIIIIYMYVKIDKYKCTQTVSLVWESDQLECRENYQLAIDVQYTIPHITKSILNVVSTKKKK